MTGAFVVGLVALCAWLGGFSVGRSSVGLSGRRRGRGRRARRVTLR